LSRKNDNPKIAQDGLPEAWSRNRGAVCTARAREKGCVLVGLLVREYRTEAPWMIEVCCSRDVFEKVPHMGHKPMIRVNISWRLAPSIRYLHRVVYSSTIFVAGPLVFMDD